MHKWMWGVLATLVAAAVIVPAVVARGAERGDRGRPAMEGATQPVGQPGPGDMERRAQTLRSQIQTLAHSAELFEQQGMPDLAQEMRTRAEQDQKELEGLMRALQQAHGPGPQEAAPMANGMRQMVETVQHQQEALDKLLQGQDKLRGQIGELNEKMNALQKEVAAVREQLGH
jgi:phage shock protein A